MRLAATCLLLVLPTFVFATTATTCKRISEIISGARGDESEFDVTACVSDYYICTQPPIAVSDATGATLLHVNAPMHPERILSGDKVRLTGCFDRRADGLVYASCVSSEILAHGVPRPIPDATGREILAHRYDCLPVKVTGEVLDVLPDEVDTHFVFLILSSGNDSVYVAVNGPPGTVRAESERLVGARVAVTGICDPFPQPSRQRMGCVVHLRNLDVLTPAPLDPFAVPELQDLGTDTPFEIARFGRRRTTGVVAAVWQRSSLLLRTPRNRSIRVTLKDGLPPAVGTTIDVAGLPETDLFRINLARATWRPGTNGTLRVAADKPAAITAAELTTDGNGHEKFLPTFHGKVIRLGGRVIGLPGLGANASRLYLDNNGYVVPVDVSALPDKAADLTIGYQLQVTGVCIMDSDVWKPNAVFPKIRGFFIVPRSPGDLVVIARPSWWTAGRLIVVIASLLAITLGISIWNYALHRLAERRGKELAAGDVARAEADMRTLERTRLAVELHDSVSQILTGAFMELETTKQFEQQAHPELVRHLGIAKQAIQSCRDELRNCLWDLRSMSLEEPVFDEAIRRTILPHVNSISTTIRFNVPRERFTDTTAHAILQIIRELTVNAIRHGHAQHIRIAGCTEGDCVLFSVSDDGMGFDPDNVPGIFSGHFGLQGIKERIGKLSGNLDITSRPGHGTRINISIPIHTI